MLPGGAGRRPGARIGVTAGPGTSGSVLLGPAGVPHVPAVEVVDQHRRGEPGLWDWLLDRSPTRRTSLEGRGAPGSRRKLHRPAHRSVTEPGTGIRTWTSERDEDPEPFAWTKAADEIPQTLAA